MIATAISAGDTAPIVEPDRRMDARDVGVGEPGLLQPLDARACVFREPSAPM